jgi:Protein of unknown function (DUF3093)
VGRMGWVGPRRQVHRPAGEPRGRGWLAVRVPENAEQPAAPAAYRERLSVPFRWWVQGTMLVATFWLAFVVATPAVVAWSATAVLLLLMTGLFLSYGAPRVEVADGWLRAGRARISGEFLGGAEPLDPATTRRVAGPEADVRAYLLLRPYLKRSVRVTVRDARDPAPYWLLSTRDPELLAAAISGISGTSATA